MALSANTTITIKNVLGQMEDSDVIKTAAIIYKGALIVAVDAGTSCQPAANDTSTMFLGMAKAGPLTGNGTLESEYIYNVHALCVGSALTAGDVGVVVYAVDDGSVHSVATLGAKVGVMTKLEATNSVWVWLRNGTEMAKAS